MISKITNYKALLSYLLTSNSSSSCI